MELEHIHQIRFKNFMLLFAEFREDYLRRFPDAHPTHGMLKRFAEHLQLGEKGPPEKYVGLLKNKHKTIGNSTAQKIEAAMGKEPGWLDREHGPAEPENARERAFLQKALERYRADPAEAMAALLLDRPDTSSD